MGAGVILVEAREAKMVMSFSGHGGEPTRRTGYFLKPTARFSHETASPVVNPSSPGTPLQGIHFTGWCYPNKRWVEWVDRMEAAHGKAWDDAGIRAAVRASTCKVRRQPELALAVADYWCPETNTFLFPWGEATMTLEDVSILGCLPLLGGPARMMAPMAGDLAEMNDRVTQELRSLLRPSHSYWLNKMDEAKGGDGELEHIAFLSLWLSRFVFPGPSENHMGRHVFPIAIRLACGERIALAPAVLASLYRDLRLLKKHSICCREVEPSENCILTSPFQLLQLWLWERFGLLRPEASPRRLCYSGEPRAARWRGLANKNLEIEYTRSVLKSSDEFQWRPYAASMENWSPSFYKDEGKWVTSTRDESDEHIVCFSRCLRPCELVGLDCIEQYLPHRVAMQFGLDQDLPGSVPRVDHSWEQAWETYDKPMHEIKFFVPPRLPSSGITWQYQLWWRQHVSPSGYAMSKASEEQGGFPSQCDKSTVKIPLGENDKRGTGKRKRGRPMKIPPVLSSTGRSLRSGLSSRQPFIVRKRRRQKSRKISALLACSN